MSVTVNGEERLLDGPTTVAELVDELCGSRRGIAVALDGEVVPRSAWSVTQLVAGHRVEIVGAAAGG